MSRFYLVILATFLLACQASNVSTADNPTRELGKNPYYKIDGKETTKSELQTIDPEQIESVSMLNKKSGRKIFGKRARDGAVLIETTEYALRLFNHVDSLITKILNYEYNEDTFVRPIAIDTTLNRPIHSSHSTFPKNPEPFILLDGEPVKKEELKRISIDIIETIEIMKPGSKSTAIFGTMGKNGAIIMTRQGFLKPPNSNK